MRTWTVGTAVDHQQVGNTWSGENNLVSLSMSGELNLFDPRFADKVVKMNGGSAEKIAGGDDDGTTTPVPEKVH